MAAPSERAKATPRAGGKKTAEVPLPPRWPQDDWQGNFNYDVTRMIDALVGQNEAQRGREYQEYYATHPWPY